MHNLITHTLFTAQAVGAGAVLTSPVVDLRFVRNIESLQLRVTSVAGVANVSAEFQSSPDATNWDNEDDNTIIVASTLTAKANNPEGWNVYPVAAPLNRYIRVLIDEISAGALADTLVDAKLLVREELGD
jgi:hypothetical protein